MKRILITGAGGQLGKCIQKQAPKFPELEFEFRTKADLDITKPDKIRKILKSKTYDYCINGAAYTAVEQAEKTPDKAYETNARGVQQLALACKKENIRLIHISTDYVFDGEKEEGYKVNDKPNPINEYGKSKLLGEKYIQEVLEQFYIVRTSWLYSEYGHNFYKTILEKARQEKTLFVTDEQLGCPTNANNLARFLIEQLVLESPPYGLYHFTDGEPMTWFSFAKKILKEKKLDAEVTVKRARNFRTVAARPRNSVLIM